MQQDWSAFNQTNLPFNLTWRHSQLEIRDSVAGRSKAIANTSFYWNSIDCYDLFRDDAN